MYSSMTTIQTWTKSRVRDVTAYHLSTCSMKSLGATNYTQQYSGETEWTMWMTMAQHTHFAESAGKKKLGGGKRLIPTIKLCMSSSENKNKDQNQILIDHYTTDLKSNDKFLQAASEKEKFIINAKVDSGDTMSQLVDNTLLTTLLKRATEVVGKIPSGNFKSLPTQDPKNDLKLNKVWDRYIVPNANSQLPMYEKLWLWSFNRLVYGSSDVLYDYVVKDGYIGPDFYIIPPRSGIPQSGRFSIESSERYTVVTKQSKAWFETLLNLDEKILKNGGWNKEAIRRIVDNTKPGSTDTGDNTMTENERNNQEATQNSGQYDVVTVYGPKKWLTFELKSKEIIRETDKNPHGTNAIPVISLRGFPLIDRYQAMSEYERLAPNHKALTHLTNLHLDGVALRTNPPTLVYMDDIVPSTFKLEPGNTIITTNPNPNAIREMQFDSQATNAFSATYGFLKAAMQTGTSLSDTSISTDFDVTMGKTPQALRMQAYDNEAFRGYFKESFDQQTSKLFDAMMSLLLVKQEAPIVVPLEDSTTFDSSDLVIEKGDLPLQYKNSKDITIPVKYKFYIDSRNPVERSQQSQKAAIQEINSMIEKIPGAMEQVQTTGKIKIGDTQINYGDLLKSFIDNSGLTGSEKIVEKVQPETGVTPPVTQNMNPVNAEVLPNPQPPQVTQAVQPQTVEVSQPPQQEQIPVVDDVNALDDDERLIKEAIYGTNS